MSFKYPATLLCDFYKVAHRAQYPKGTEVVYSTWTPRTSRIPGIDKVVAFGFQAFIKEYLIEYFNEHFFDRLLTEVREEYRRVIIHCLGDKNPDDSHIIALWELRYLPIIIRAVDEGTLVPIRCPMLTIENTKPEFFWLTNYLETLMSCSLWQAATSATLALQYRKMLNKWADLTGGDMDFVPFQGHDFSMRGMSSLESAAVSGAGHLLSFTGTDTIPAILYHEHFYGADMEKEFIAGSIAASEHSTACANGMDEFATFKRLLTEVYPSGFVSIVSDTWDLWKVITEVVAGLKDVILKRDGRLVVRPDSGDPVKIICGDPESTDERVRKGVVELLWDIFGGTINEKGYKVLDSHIGCIYGDAITLERCEAICKNLEAKGFASTNMVFGIGSYTYQYNTRDTFGFALKSTYCEINGKAYNLFKDPVTDNGVKKSQKGKVVVVGTSDGMMHLDSSDEQDYNAQEWATHWNNNLLTPVFVDGKLVKETNLSDIRNRIAQHF